MATGKQHAEALQLAAVPAGLLALYITSEVETAVAVAIGVLAGIIIDPDLDMVQPTRSEWQMRQALGLIGHVWAWYWLPYAWLVPHRSWISHKPVIGTAIRVSYLLILPLIFVPTLAQLVANKYFFVGLIGLATADTIHWFMDGLP